MNTALFDLPSVDAPRCRMCPRPARLIPKKQEFGAYCAGRHCSNSTRICRACGQLFDLDTGEAGTKYCSTECKRVGYHPTSSPAAAQRCAWCAAPRAQRRRDGAWPYVCQPCLSPVAHVLGRLRDHRVPLDLVRRLIDDPACPVCQRDLLEKVPSKNTGRLQARLVVDHDHSCCMGQKSCGRCVRGLVCSECNIAAGMVRDDAGIARRLAEYLAAFSEARRAA